MTEVTLSSDLDVKFISGHGSDELIVAAARVSQEVTLPEDVSETEGLINYLMKHRHGSPFEHNGFTFLVHAPIFVAREFQRHRIASYNEQSARYGVLQPKFYFAEQSRPRFNSGTSARPVLNATVGIGEYEILYDRRKQIAQAAWDEYQSELSSGYANEVAREVLPVNIYTSFYVTMNARSAMNFLSLRTDEENAAIKGYPLLEMQTVAKQIEEVLKEHMPVTMQKFDVNGRVCP